MRRRFSDGARVCFIGDSLVAQNHMLPRLIDFYRTHFPDSGIEFINCGTAGGTVTHALQTLEDDVLIHKPTHAVVAFGVNDSMRWALSEPASPERYAYLVSAYETYRRALPELCERILAQGIELILGTPAPYAEYQESVEEAYHGGFSLMQGYADFVRQYAYERKISLCDYHTFMTAKMQGDALYTPDRVHPSPHGYYHMAECFLAYQGLTIDDEEADLTYLDEWKGAVAKLRELYSAECMLVKDYSLPLEEKLARLRAYLEDDTSKNPYMEFVARQYIENYSQKDVYIRNINVLYARDVLGY